VKQEQDSPGIEGAPAWPAAEAQDSARSPLDYLFFRASEQVSQEHAQAISRLVITALMTAAVALAAVIDGISDTERVLLTFGLCYGLIAAGFYRHLSRATPSTALAGTDISTAPTAPTGGARSPIARNLAMLCDLCGAGFITYIAGLAGLGFYPIFIWIIIGNGLRFGRRSLAVASLLGMISFVAANLLNGVAYAQPGVFAGLVVGLLMLPHFLHLALARLAATNSELQQQKEQAQYLARHDTLTGLPNRQLLLQRLVHALHRAQRNHYRLAVLFIDLDGFKRLNDSYGHDYGDRLLVLVGDCLRATVRQMDTVSRLGGDEFILLIEEYDSSRDISAVVERLFGCARRFYNIKGMDAYLTWSCGIAVYPKDGDDAHTLIKHADIAMYRAKAQGGNRAVSYDSAMSHRVIADLRMRDELRHAIDAREFFVLYQPQYRASDGALAGLEALVRWRHPRLGALAPKAFLAVAVESGLMRQIDRLVFDIAIGDVAALRRQAVADLRLALNVAPQQLMDQDFANLLEAALKGHDLPPSALDIEITEHALIDETEISHALLQHLRRLGMRIALDDFGTGYSALAHLRHLAVDVIKLDRSLIRGIPGDTGDCALVEGILSIARRTELVVAAEGIENAAQRDWLQQQGCDLMQGFYFGKPMHIDEIGALRLTAAPAAAAPDDETNASSRGVAACHEG